MISLPRSNDILHLILLLFNFLSLFIINLLSLFIIVALSSYYYQITILNSYIQIIPIIGISIIGIVEYGQ